MESKKRICNVKECPLHGHKPVWGQGPYDPVCILIGEAPGADEESYGIPFCGKSGQELDMYLSRFTKVARENIYITNLVKCRPPKNRDPHADEILFCGKYLSETLQLCKPAVIGTVGRVSTKWFLRCSFTMEKVHGIPQKWGSMVGEWTGCEDAVILPLYHPAYGLHSPRRMKDVIDDFEALGEVIRGRQSSGKIEKVKLDYELEE